MISKMSQVMPYRDMNRDEMRTKKVKLPDGVSSCGN